jgi:hypothetical protein
MQAESVTQLDLLKHAIDISRGKVHPCRRPNNFEF